MKLSSDTLGMLRNFALINPDIQIYAGSTLKTVSQGGDLFAQAEVSDEFPVDFALYRMKRFLDAMALLDDPDLKFSETSVRMEGANGNSISFTYASPKIVISPPKDLDLTIKQPGLEFDIAEEEMSRLLRAATAMELPSISFIVEDGDLKIKAHDSDNASSDNFVIEVSDADADDDLHLVVKAELMKMPADGYKIKVKNDDRPAISFENSEVFYMVSAKHFEGGK